MPPAERTAVSRRRQQPRTSTPTGATPSPEEIAWLRQELDSNAATASAEFEVVDVPRSGAQLMAAQEAAGDHIPPDLLENSAVAYGRATGIVSVFVADEAAAARVREQLDGAPEWVEVVVNPEELGADAHLGSISRWGGGF